MFSQIRDTLQYRVFDLDGHEIALFWGYAVRAEFGTLCGLFQQMPEAAGVTILARDRTVRGIVRRLVAPPPP